MILKTVSYLLNSLGLEYKWFKTKFESYSKKSRKIRKHQYEK